MSPIKMWLLVDDAAAEVLAGSGAGGSKEGWSAATAAVVLPGRADVMAIGA